MIELELTYLAKTLPQNLSDCESKKMIDFYIENGSTHLHLRVRKNGNNFEITHKSPVVEGDVSKQTEITIPLTEEEFKSLSTSRHRIIEKSRYYYTYKNLHAEVDVFEGALSGLVLVDFEFDTEVQQQAFAIPDFCLADVTQEEFIAGGMLAGKRYEDIEIDLKKFGYQKLVL